jgi:hypothetical protein
MRLKTTERRVANAVAFRLNPVPWISGDGITQHQVAHMTDSHIRSCVTMMRQGRMKRVHTSGLTQLQWIAIFENELYARNFLAQHVGV